MLTRYLLFTFLSCTPSATLPSQILTRQTILPSTTLDTSTLNLTLSPLNLTSNLTSTTSHCWDSPQPRIWVWPARLPDCELAAYRILRFIDPFKPVTFSHAAGSSFQLPADYRYKSCWIHLNIDPGQADRFQPQTAYLAAWELARDCTSGMYQFGGRRTVGPREKVVIHIYGVYVPGVGEEEAGLMEVEVRDGIASVTADE